MALILPDRVKVRSTSSGTGTFTLTTVIEGFRDFSAVGDGNETYYGIVDYSGHWEIGRGTWTESSNTLSRDTVISSSNNNSKVNFLPGGKTVYATFPSSLAQALFSSSTPDTFSTISVAGQSDVNADSSADTLTLAAGSGIEITTDASTDTITITNSATLDLSSVSQDIVPSIDSDGTTGYSLGSASFKWKELFVSTGSIYIGDVKLSNTAGKIVATKVLNPGTAQEQEDPEDGNAFSNVSGSGSTDRLTTSDTSVVLDTDGNLTFSGGASLSTNSDGTALSMQIRNGTGVGFYSSENAEMYTTQGINLYTNTLAGAHQWTFGTDGVLSLPSNGDIQINGQSVIGGTGTPNSNGTFSTLPDFLDFYQGTSIRVGQNSEGIFFSGDANDSLVSYPIRTNFSIPGNTKVTVLLDMVVNDPDLCSDFSLCVFESEVNPEFQWGSNTTRLAAQYDCPQPLIQGTIDGASSSYSLPSTGTYRVRFTYDPNNTPNLKLETLDTSNTVLDTITYDETLNTNKSYQIGFAADQDAAELRTYIKNLSIVVDGGNTYTDDLLLASTITYLNSGYLLLMSNADGTILYSEDDGATWTGPVASGVNPIGKTDVHGGVIVFTRSDYEADVRQTGLYYSATIGTSVLCSGTDIYSGPVTPLQGTDLYWNEVRYIGATSTWVAAGYAEYPQRTPAIAYSTDGINWIVVPADLDYITAYNTNNFDWQFNDVAYDPVNGLYVFASSINDLATFGGFFYTSDLTIQLSGGNHWQVPANFRVIQDWNVSTFGGPPDYMIALTTEQTIQFWTGVASDVQSWTSSALGWLGSTAIDTFGYEPSPVEMVSSGPSTIITTSDGQIITLEGGPATALVPLPYSSEIFDIVRPAALSGLPTIISILNGEPAPKADGEKIVISSATSFDGGEPDTSQQDYNGTYYIKNNNGTFELYTDQALTTPWDTSSYWPVTNGGSGTSVGTITWSHGQFIDAAGVAGTNLYIGNDDEQVFVSSDYGVSWTLVTDVTGEYFNDFAYGTFGIPTVNTGNITFSGNQIRGTEVPGDYYGLIELVPSTTGVNGPQTIDFLATGQYLKIYPTVTFDEPHIHITAGAGSTSTGDLFLGDDTQYVKIANDGSIKLTTNFSNTVSLGFDGVLETNGSVYVNGEGKGLIVDNVYKRVGFMKYTGMEASFIHANTHPFQIGRVNGTDVTTTGMSDFTSEMYISSTGKVGINNPTPVEQLDVEGNIKTTGRLIMTGTVPKSSLGVAGDIAGMVAVDNNTIYYCIADYGATYSALFVGNYSGTYPEIYNEGVPKPLAGWTFSYNATEYTILTDAEEGNPGHWSLSLDQAISTIANDNITLNPSLNIWVKQDWGTKGSW